MHVLTSQLAGDGRNADRVLVTKNAVLVLDGASAFEPVPVDPGEYAETLGRAVADRLDAEPEAYISDVVADSIRSTARAFNLHSGYSPSSTIALLRVREEVADLYVLGDSPIYYGTDAVTLALHDDRLSMIAKPQRSAYIAALRAGRGYGSEHRNALAALQRVQRQYRNRPNGYWIAETDPSAAYHAFKATVKPASGVWAVLGTDGATDLIATVSSRRWPEIANYDQARLDDLLRQIHEWELDSDPAGRKLPRAKRHDDKTLAVVAELF